MQRRMPAAGGKCGGGDSQRRRGVPPASLHSSTHKSSGWQAHRVPVAAQAELAVAGRQQCLRHKLGPHELVCLLLLLAVRCGLYRALGSGAGHAIARGACKKRLSARSPHGAPRRSSSLPLGCQRRAWWHAPGRPALLPRVALGRTGCSAARHCTLHGRGWIGWLVGCGRWLGGWRWGGAGGSKGVVSQGPSVPRLWVEAMAGQL